MNIRIIQDYSSSSKKLIIEFVIQFLFIIIHRLLENLYSPIEFVDSIISLLFALSFVRVWILDGREMFVNLNYIMIISPWLHIPARSFLNKSVMSFFSLGDVGFGMSRFSP